MPVYRYGPVVFDCRFTLPGLAPAARRVPRWIVRGTAAPPPRVVRWTHHRVWPGTRSRYQSLAHPHPHRSIVRVRDVATFVIDEATRRVTCHRTAGPSAVRDALVSDILPLVASLDHLVLHASAVRTPAGLILFVGSTGQGKTTLAIGGALLRGWALASDDVVFLRRGLDGWIGIPDAVAPRPRRGAAEALRGIGVHLTGVPDRRTRRVPRADDGSASFPRSTSPAPVASIFVLDGRPPGDAPAVVALPAGDAVTGLLSHSFTLGRLTRGSLLEHFEMLTALHAAVPVRLLAYPHRTDALVALWDRMGVPEAAGRSGARGALAGERLPWHDLRDGHTTRHERKPDGAGTSGAAGA